MTASALRSSDVRNSPASREVLAWLRDVVAAMLDVQPSAIDAAARFRELGLTSAQLTLLTVRIAERYGCTLPATTAWHHPTPRALAQHIVEQLAPRAATAPPFAAISRGEVSRAEPIALIGIGCRLPGGVRSAAELWTLLCEGRSGICEVPKDRWDCETWVDENSAAPGKMNTRWGGFLDAIDTFDAAFFSISPREAVQIDPQQRLSLELAWEALEDAGIDPTTLCGQPVGVFFGAMWSDYGRLAAADATTIDLHTATGQDTSIIAARISYTLGLEGTSLTVNTACSSSLVALHLACQSLRLGELDAALVGGVNLMIAPESTVAMTKFGGLNPAGQCRSFDASANGYVRGEGGGVVVLKPLSRAIADGDRIYCVIRGSATNNDGFSNGLTAPNPLAQQAVLRAAYKNAGIDPATVQYIETHGPGTILGDPIEAEALSAVLCRGRQSDRPLHIGSVKSNIGHLEAAAGVIGLIKTALALHHGLLPKNLHFERPNPRIHFDTLNLKVQSSLQGWPADGEPRRAGVSSFGFGGTNCHAVLEAAPRSQALLLPLSAENPSALRRVALSALDLLTQVRNWEEAAALCRTLAMQGCGPLRRAVAGHSAAQLITSLTRLLAEKPPDPALSRPRVVFVCPGQGSQWLGMGRSLLVQEPVFRAEIEACDRIVRTRYGFSIVEELLADAQRSRLDETDVLQPVLFAVQVALGALWRSYGVVPDALVGHSQGEVAAAFLAGVLSLDDALCISCERSRLLRANVSKRGAMLVIPLSTEKTPSIDQLLAAEPLTLAAWNSPRSVVLSGDLAAIARLETQLRQQGVQTHRVAIDYASHSPLMDPILAPLEAAIATITPRTADVPLRSTVEETWLSGPECGAAYWVRNLREPVRFRQAIEALASEGRTVFIELDLHPVMLKAVEQTLEALQSSSRILPTGWRNEDERECMLRSLATLSSLGVTPNWSVALAAQLRETVPASIEAANTAPDVPFLLSGRGEAALRAQATRLHAHLVAHPEQSLVQVAGSLATTRAHLETRAVVIAGQRAELLTRLETLSREGSAASVRSGEGRLAMLFTGQGSQRPGMGRGLYTRFPRFRDALDRIVAAFAPHLPRSLREVMFAEPGSTPAEQLSQTAFTQPALFALEVALYRLWEDLGLKPDLLLGHSVGELAAAHVSGVLSLADACTLVAARGRLMQELPPGGAMVSLEASEAELRPLLAQRTDVIEIAAINGPTSTVISGEEDAVLALAQVIEARGRRATRLQVSHAFHSPRMDAMLAGLRSVASRLVFHPPQLAIVSGVTGRLASAAELCSADYWVRQARQPVRFLDGMQLLEAEGITTCLELGPQGALCTLGRECVSSAVAAQVVFLPSLRRERPEAETLLSALGAVHLRGHAIDWQAYFASLTSRRVTLPTYAFARQRYWHASPSRATVVSPPKKDADPPRTDVAGWFHQLEWRPVSLADASADGGWLILDAGDGDDAARIGKALERLGGTITVCSPTTEDGVASLDGLLTESLRGIVFLASAGSAAPRRFLEILRGLVRNPSFTPSLWLITRGAVVIGDELASDSEQAALWGLGRVLALELPRLWGGMIDLPTHGCSDALARAVAAGLAGTQREEQLAVRDAGTFTLRLVPRSPSLRAPRLSMTGTALVTGGLGAVGLRVARWLVQSGMKSLLLVGRRGLETPGAADVVAELEALGATVRVEAADITDREAMSRLLATLPTAAPLRAVFHAAGLADSTPLVELDADRLANVMKVRATGAQILLELVAAQHLEGLEAFVAFTSVAGIWGSGGQGACAAADAALVARMGAARARGVPAVTVAWGPWSGATDAATAQRLARRGLRTLPLEGALEALSVALRSQLSQLVVADVDWPKLRPTLEVWSRRSLLSELPGEADRSQPPPFRSELVVQPPIDRAASLRQWLTAQCGVVMGYADGAALDAQRDLFDLGMESLMVAELRCRLLSGLGLHVPIASIFRHATIDALTGHLLERLVATSCP